MSREDFRSTINETSKEVARTYDADEAARYQQTMIAAKESGMAGTDICDLANRNVGDGFSLRPEYLSRLNKGHLELLTPYQFVKSLNSLGSVLFRSGFFMLDPISGNTYDEDEAEIQMHFKNARTVLANLPEVGIVNLSVCLNQVRSFMTRSTKFPRMCSNQLLSTFGFVYQNRQDFEDLSEEQIFWLIESSEEMLEGASGVCDFDGPEDVEVVQQRVCGYSGCILGILGAYMGLSDKVNKAEHLIESSLVREHHKSEQHVENAWAVADYFEQSGFEDEAKNLHDVIARTCDSSDADFKKSFKEQTDSYLRFGSSKSVLRLANSFAARLSAAATIMFFMISLACFDSSGPVATGMEMRSVSHHESSNQRGVGGVGCLTIRSSDAMAYSSVETLEFLRMATSVGGVGALTTEKEIILDCLSVGGVGSTAFV